MPKIILHVMLKLPEKDKFAFILTYTVKLPNLIRFYSVQKFDSESESVFGIEFFVIFAIVDSFRPNRTKAPYPNTPLNPIDLQAKEALALSSKMLKNGKKF